MSADLPQRVRTERTRRGWSARAAAGETRRPDSTGARPEGITNTTWSRFEKGETELTPNVQGAIAWAFDWPTNWPDIEVSITEVVKLSRQLDGVDQKVEQLGLSLAEALGQLRGLTDGVEQLLARPAVPGGGQARR